MATSNYRLERLATALLAASAAALLGWACALALGIWGDRQLARLAPWRPFALQAPVLDSAAAASPTVSSGTMKLAGVAGDRAYFVGVGNAATRGLSLSAGESLPSGEKLVRVDRDGVVLAAGGTESRVSVLPQRIDNAKKMSAGPVAAPCRLSGGDRVGAIFIAEGVIKALTAERATLSRMFEPVQGVGGAATGVRAKGTGGTTAMFAISDGDVLTRVDGTTIRSSDAIVTELLARLDRGASVVVEGESKGTPKRWVYAPAGCASSGAHTVEPANAKVSSKASG